MTPVLLVLNAGSSSSLKFQVFAVADSGEPHVALKGQFGGLGGATHFVVNDAAGSCLGETTWPAGDVLDHEEALLHPVAWLREHREGRELVDIDDVGLTAAYLTTPFARRLTGTTTYVDGGLSIMA